MSNIREANKNHTPSLSPTTIRVTQGGDQSVTPYYYHQLDSVTPISGNYIPSGTPLRMEF